MAFIYDLSDTWNAGATTFTAIKMNVTDTASAAGSKLIDLQVGGTTRFDVNKNGQVEISAGTALLPSLATLGDTNTGMWFPAADTIAWSTGGSERVRISDIGRLLLGGSLTVPDAYNASIGVRLFQAIGSSASFGPHRNDNTAFGHAFLFSKARGTGFETLINGDVIGLLDFHGANGSGYNRAGEIRCIIDGVVSGGGVADMPGALLFSTTPDGSGTPLERLRITSAGNVGIGTSTSDERLVVAGALVSTGSTLANKTSAVSFDYFSSGTTARILSWGPVGTNAAISFLTGSGGAGATERARISGNGNLGLGTSTFGTSAVKSLAIGTGTAPTTGPADTIQIYSTDLSAGNTMFSLFTEGTVVNANTTAAATHRIAIRVNGTVYYLLANTAA